MYEKMAVSPIMHVRETRLRTRMNNSNQNSPISTETPSKTRKTKFEEPQTDNNNNTHLNSKDSINSSSNKVGKDAQNEPTWGRNKHVNAHTFITCFFLLFFAPVIVEYAVLAMSEYNGSVADLFYDLCARFGDTKYTYVQSLTNFVHEKVCMCRLMCVHTMLCMCICACVGDE